MVERMLLMCLGRHPSVLMVTSQQEISMTVD